MKFSRLFFICGLVTLCLISLNQVFSSGNEPTTKVKDEISELLETWTNDFNAKNAGKVCELFAPDIIASYQGTENRNYETICKNFKEALSDPYETYHYEKPKIEQILVDDNTAVVRLIWTLKITGTDVDVITEKGLDVFRRQNDGSWKIAISYAYPESE